MTFESAESAKGDAGKETKESARAPAPGEAVAARRRRRTYREAAAVRRDGGWIIALDDKPAATPAGAPLLLPTLGLAEAIAAEWAAQGEVLDPQSMPLTGLANAALDGVAGEAGAVRDDLAGYARADLLVYRAGEPDSLAAAQRRAWDPVLDWARKTLGARFVLSEGVVFVAQPEEALAAMRRATAGIPAPFGLAALHAMTTLTGSILLALAVAHERLSAEEAWGAAHVDEDEQMRVWGEDAEAAERRARRWREMAAAALAIRLLSRP